MTHLATFMRFGSTIYDIDVLAREKHFLSLYFPSYQCTFCVTDKAYTKRKKNKSIAWELFKRTFAPRCKLLVEVKNPRKPSVLRLTRQSGSCLLARVEQRVLLEQHLLFLEVAGLYIFGRDAC